MPSTDWWLDLVPATLLVALAIWNRHTHRSWLAPGAFFALTWAVFIWLALIFLPDVAAPTAGVWWVALSVGLVAAGSWLGIRFHASRSQTDSRRPPAVPAWPGLEVLVIACSILGFVGLGFLLYSEGHGFSTFLSPASLAHAARALSIARYAGYQEPLVYRALLAALYFGAALAGLLLAARRPDRARWIIALLPIGSAAATALVATTRATLLYTIVLLAGAYLAASILRCSARPRWSVRLLWLALSGVGALALIAVTSQMLRDGNASPAHAIAVIAGLRFDAFGYVDVFSTWFQGSGLHTGHLSFGADSFAGVFDLLHLKARVGGIYTTNVYLGPQHHPSNIYTIFRGLIEDYSPVGSLALLFIIGAVVGFCFAGLRRGQHELLPLLFAFYAATLWSFVVNLFAYTTIVIAWAFLAVYVWVVPRIQQGRALTPDRLVSEGAPGSILRSQGMVRETPTHDTGVDGRLLPILVCPLCTSALSVLHDGRLHCVTCASRYDIRDGIPDLVREAPNRNS